MKRITKVKIDENQVDHISSAEQQWYLSMSCAMMLTCRIESNWLPSQSLFLEHKLISTVDPAIWRREQFRWIQNKFFWCQWHLFVWCQWHLPLKERLQVVQEFIPSMGCVGYRLVALKVKAKCTDHSDYPAKEKEKHLKLFLCFDIVVENPMISTQPLPGEWESEV